MLVQLVCLDRRYQRMNCYNIREIQTLLKSQYSPNSKDEGTVNLLLSETVLGLRYKLMSLTSVDSTMLNYYRHSLNSSSLSHVFLTSPLTFAKYLNENHFTPALTSFEYMILKNFYSTTFHYFSLFLIDSNSTSYSPILADSNSFRSSEILNLHQKVSASNVFLTYFSNTILRLEYYYNEVTTFVYLFVGKMIIPFAYAIRGLGAM